MDYSMLLYVHLCNVDKIKYKTIEKDFYERLSKFGEDGTIKFDEAVEVKK